MNVMPVLGLVISRGKVDNSAIPREFVVRHHLTNRFGMRIPTCRTVLFKIGGMKKSMFAIMER